MIEIEDFFTIYKNAAWQRDATTLLKLYDANVIQFDMWDKGYYTNLQEWKPEIENWLGSLGEERVNVDFEMLKIHKSENLGFASGLIIYEAISPEGKVLRGMKNRITLGFLRFEDGWKVIHQHISAPVTSKHLSAILDF